MRPNVSPTDIGIALVLLAGVNQTQQYTAGLVSSDTVMGGATLIATALFAVAVWQARRRAVDPGESLAQHYLHAIGLTLAIDIIGVLGVVATALVAVDSFGVGIPFYVYTALAGAAGGIVGFIGLLVGVGVFHKRERTASMLNH